MDAAATNDRWSPFPNPRDTTRFCRLVFGELEARGLAYTGTPPMLRSAAGPAKVLYLDNVALRCAGLKRARWPDVVREFLDTITYLDTIEDPTAQSPEVVRAGLRLRLSGAPPAQSSGSVVGAPLPDDADGIRTQLVSQIVHRPAMPGMVWLLYVRIPGGAFGVSADRLQGWGIGMDEAFELARDHADTEPQPRLRCRGNVHMVDGACMFTHTAVLHPEALVTSASDGWFVSVPSREQVLAVRAEGSRRGLDRMAELVRATAEGLTMSGYALSLSPWFVPPSGIGRFGEDAELVDLRRSAIDGTIQRVRLGPKVHALFGALEDGL